MCKPMNEWCIMVVMDEIENLDTFETEDPIDDEDEGEESTTLSIEEAQKLLTLSINETDLLNSEDDVQKQIREITLAPARSAQKPNIDYLEDAIIETEEHGFVFLSTEGDGLIIQFPQNWRDTTYYIVRRIDYETGAVALWNPQRKQWAGTNFFDAKRFDLVVKIPPEGASHLRMALALGQRKRGRPRKNPVEAATAEPVEKSGRGRGRPKGSKNRPKEVIAAEKKALREERNAKAQANSARHRSR